MLMLIAALQEKGRLKESIEAYYQAIHLQPDHAESHVNLGIIFLLKGNFLQGWKEYEWRWKCNDPQTDRRHFVQPAWNGSSLNGKTIFLYAEQGFGDTIQFIRYVNMLAVYEVDIIVECQPELLKLFENIDAITELIVSRESQPDFDVHASLLSLPGILGTGIESIPSEVPYLFPKSSPFVCLSSNSKLKVGIVWAGNLKHPNDSNRSIDLHQFSVLFDIGDCEFYSLQIGAERDDIIAYNYSGTIIDLGINFTDFFDTATAILELDLVISVDTAVAHLTGALGKQVWTLLPYMSDWRWMLDREDTPWYPSMRLFRQSETRDWSGVFDQVRLALEQYMEHNTTEGKP